MEKKLLRNRMKALRDALSKEERLSFSLDIMKQVVSHDAFLRAEDILIFMHYGSEVRTDGIIAHAISLGKQVFVPRVAGRQMDFYEIRDISECSPGYMKIPEPSVSAKKFCRVCDKMRETDKERTLMILPGLAFDQKGRRLGYGGGFYDRYLAEYDNCTKLGIAYDFQIVEEVQNDAQDICVDGVITEKQIVQCSRQRKGENR